MRIENDMPFEDCESCTDCVLNVDEQILFSSEKAMERVIFVGCKNERLCRHLRESIEKEKRK